ncbi:tyrosine-type recombinase/integrase, partial [Nocardia amamiensis]
TPQARGPYRNTSNNPRRELRTAGSPTSNATRTPPHTATAERSHTYATGLLRRGVAAEVVQRLLGHSSISVTVDTYAHLKIEDTRRVLAETGFLDTPADTEPTA